MSLPFGLEFEEENERGCGFRQLHGLYLCSEPMMIEACDRLEEINECPCCGERPRFNQGISKINFESWFGEHLVNEDCCPHTQERDSRGMSMCPVCVPNPDYQYYIDWVGSDYNPDSLLEESKTMGFSRRLNWRTIPNDFDLSKAFIVFAKKNGGGEVEGFTPNQGKNAKADRKDILFGGFKPSRIDYLISEEEAQDEEYVNKLRNHGITLKVVKNTSAVHQKRMAKRKKIIPDSQD